MPRLRGLKHVIGIMHRFAAVVGITMPRLRGLKPSTDTSLKPADTLESLCPV